MVESKILVLLISKVTVYWSFMRGIARIIRNCTKRTVSVNSQLSFLWDPWCSGYSVADLLGSSSSSFLLHGLSHLPPSLLLA